MPPALDFMQFGPHLDVAASSSAGVAGRLENQDNLLLIDTHGRAIFLRDQQETRQRVPGWPPGHARVAVLDGMGGHGQGREAAEAVVAGLLAMPPCHSLGELSARLDALHADLQRHFAGADHSKRPGTTLTLLELRPGQSALLYHVGDSRLYRLAGEQVTPLTVDHVPATAFAMAGLLDESQWWQQVHGEHRSQISQAFVLGNAFANPAILSDPLYELTPLNLPPWLCQLNDRRALELQPGATYLLASDGFWACAEPYSWVGSWPALLAGCTSARAMVMALFDAIRRAPPPRLHADNLTAIVLRVRDSRHEETALPMGN
ncbi:MAG: protein phosphatase [Pseudomonadota bacterium]